MFKFAKHAVLPLLAVTLLTPAVTSADTMEWRVYNYVTKMHFLPYGFAKAPANAIFERRGIVQFTDGELATYLTRGSAKLTPKGGVAEGYAQYTFDDESTMIIKWQAKSGTEEGQKLKTMSGTGSYVSGTGRFEGIKGELTLTGKYLTPYSVEKGMMGDMVVDVVSNYQLPAK